MTSEQRRDQQDASHPTVLSRLRVGWFRRVHGIDVFDSAPGFDVQNRPVETRRAAGYERAKPPVAH